MAGSLRAAAFIHPPTRLCAAGWKISGKHSAGKERVGNNFLISRLRLRVRLSFREREAASGLEVMVLRFLKPQSSAHSPGCSTMGLALVFLRTRVAQCAASCAISSQVL